MTEIFVFGSNRAGIHGAGAAKYAFKFLDAVWGMGEGLTQQTYALPTKGYKIECITLAEVKRAVDTFISIAKAHPDKDFRVTRVGCGLGGHNDQDVAPLFKDAPTNCKFDSVWEEFLPGKRFWGTY